MATTYAAQATVTARIQAKHTRSDELGVAAEPVDLGHTLQLGGDSSIDLIYKATLIADETPIVIGGADRFVDAFGVSRGFQSVKFIQIVNRSTDGSIEITGVSDFHGLADGIVIGAGGCYLVTHPDDGWQTVGDGDATFSLLSLEDPATVDVVIGGVSY